MQRLLVWLLLLALAPGRLPCQISDQALLDSLQRTAFNFFWYEANPANGLIRDRSASDAPCSIASVGFGLTALCVGVDHGWVTRAAARDRVLTTLRTFWSGPQGTDPSGMIGYKGLFYHFLTMDGAVRTWNCELSTIDTGLLLAGIVYVKQYFDGPETSEAEIRALSDSIYFRMDWNFMRNLNPGILMGWEPGTQFGGYGQWIGYNEAMIMYILALGSPTHPVPSTSWRQWTSGYKMATHYGYSYIEFPPLFGHQYSHCWIDFRAIQDAYTRVRGLTYFENSRLATYAQRAYCIANPSRFAGYGDSLWGLTACDGPPPNDYIARGAPPAQNDDGTIAPTAAGGSIPFAPEICIPALRNMYNTYRPALWGRYGFKDAFNIAKTWVAADVIGIDQGPIILMIENYLNQKVWTRFMANADVQRGLQRAGFGPMTSILECPVADTELALLPNSPNPFNTSTVLRFRLPERARIRLTVIDLLGEEVAMLLEGEREAGEHIAVFDAGSRPSGVYVARLEAGAARKTLRILLLK